MTRFMNATAGSSSMSTAAAASAEAAFPCASHMTNSILVVLGTTLLVSIFVVLSLITLVRLQAIIILVVSIITLVLIQLHRPSAILKEPPELP